MRKLLTLIALFIGSVLFAQTSITGKVIDENNQPIPGANIKVAGQNIGTTADFDGNFELKVDQSPPFKIEVSLMGFTTEIIDISQNEQNVEVILKESATALDEVVISASRTPERILESPVTVERMDARAIKNSTSANFYSSIENLKGVDLNTNSLTFTSVNTRGFAAFSNTRFMQLVDGMDNSSPALNFVIGNALGINELDVNTVELLPGASSALYGANAFNGILFMTSKNPFDSAGISSYVKTGITSQIAAGDNNYIDVGIRLAYKFSEKFAAKASFSYLKGTDWYATDYRDFSDVTLTRDDDPAYNGLNIYGDEVSTTLDFDAAVGLPTGTLGTAVVSRTGYKEVDLMDYDASTTKLDVALHYRPFANDIELIYNGRLGLVNTVYQGTNRYSLQNMFMMQNKLELKGDNFFIRGYMTDENAGDAYDAVFTGININRSWKSDIQWFTDYVAGYAGAVLGAGMSSEAAHAAGRANAQVGELLPGTAEFDQAFETVTNNPDLGTGSKFVDQTKLYHFDANYNFADKVEFADIMVGGSYRLYSLNSEGTIFTDYDGAINYNEYGAYTQIQKKLIDDRLKLTGSIRYDKAQNFDGNVSPRFSISYSLGEGKTRNIRASIQTGFRNPTTQDQYIGLDAGRAILVGSAPDNLDRYTKSFTASDGSSVTLVGRDAYDNSFSKTSVENGTFKKSYINLVKPETVTALELGYRAGFGKLALDMSAYYNKYKDFIGNVTVLVPYYGIVKDETKDDDVDNNDANHLIAISSVVDGDYKAFSTYTNSSADISSYGATIGVTSKVFGNFDVGLNYTFAKFDFDEASDPDYEASFNTPEHKIKASFGNTSLFENFGFGINYRWSDEYLWEATFADGIVESRSVFDAQVNYTIPKIKSVFKIGGSNIGGKEYLSAPGTGKVGSQYYISWTINP